MYVHVIVRFTNIMNFYHLLFIYRIIVLDGEDLFYNHYNCRPDNQ